MRCDDGCGSTEKTWKMPFVEEFDLLNFVVTERVFEGLKGRSRKGWEAGEGKHTSTGKAGVADVQM